MKQKKKRQKTRGLTLAWSAICLTSSGRLRSETIFATLMSTKPSRSERGGGVTALLSTLVYTHTHTHTHTIWIKEACFTFPALQRDQVTLEVERLYKHLHEVELSLNAWTNKILSFLMLLKECGSNGNEMYRVSLTHLDSAEFVLLSGVIVNHHHKVITDVAFLIAAALVALAVRHQSGYMEDGCRETKHLH